MENKKSELTIFDYLIMIMLLITVSTLLMILVIHKTTSQFVNAEFPFWILLMFIIFLEILRVRRNEL